MPTAASAGSAGSATAQSAASSNRWLFSGKESQSFLSTDIPLLDFGARMYNPITARWTTADPMADKYYDISPYGYCLNNPITHIDDDGQMPHVVAGALIGATVSGVIAAVEGKSWREIAAAATGGAVEGAIVSATGGLSLIKAGIVYVTASALGSATEQMIDHGAIDAKQTISDGIVGAVTTTAGNYVNCGIEKAGSRIATKINTYYSSEEVKHSILGKATSARVAFDSYQILSNISDNSTCRTESKSSRVPEYYGWVKGYLNYKSKRRNYWYLYDR